MPLLLRTVLVVGLVVVTGTLVGVVPLPVVALFLNVVFVGAVVLGVVGLVRLASR